MKKFSTYLVLATLGLAAVGCSDDSDDAAPSKTSLLTAKSWQPTSLVAVGTTLNLLDALQEPCDKDDFIKFNANKTAVYDQGADKCDSADDQTANGQWEFTNNETKLKLTDPDGEVTEGTITTLNSTTMTLRVSQDLGVGVPVTADLTLTAK